MEAMSLLLTVLLSQQLTDAQAKERLDLYAKAAGNEQSPDKVIVALTHLRGVRHPTLLAKLKTLVKHKSDQVRREVLYDVADYTGNDEARAILVEQIEPELKKPKLNDQATDEGHELVCALIGCMPRFKPDAGTLKALTGALAHKNISVAKSAAGALGAMKDAGSAEAMIALLTELETIKAEKVDNQTKNANGDIVLRKLTSKEAVQQGLYRRKTELGEAVNQALAQILGAPKPTAAEYAALWAQKKP